MSGIAIVIPGADFSAKNLGQVTFLEDVDVASMSINGADAVTGITSTYAASYLPANTNQKGCTWSIESGAQYASINASTGVLTVLEGANANSVTIKATSTFNSAITASKTIAVTYVETVDELTEISISGDSEVGAGGAQYSIIYNPTNSNYKGVTWGISSGSSLASIDQSGNLTVTGSGSVTIQAISTHNTVLTATKTVTVSNAQAAVAITLSSAYPQGILTDIVVADISTAEMEVYFMPRGQGGSGFGSRSSDKSSDSFIIRNNYTSNTRVLGGLYGGVSSSSKTTVSGNIYTCVLNSLGCTIDGTLHSYSGMPTPSTNNTAPIAIGNIYNSDTSSWNSWTEYGGNRIGYIKIKENGILIHNLQPYQNGSDFGFKDLITNKTYSAAGLNNSSYMANING
ncbi:MAG: hypothetical protein ACRCUJ_14975 [Phocaeicola sp.]